jgi:uncharacterized membrane protein
MKKQKAIEWLKRYLPAEIAGTITALIAASIAKNEGYNAIIIAFTGSLGEAIGFYISIFINHLLNARKAILISDKRNLNFQDYLVIVAKILLEFGPAGLIDDFIVRPFFMFWLPILLNNFTLGIIAGKIVGDVSFYFLVILSYELIKNRKTKNNAAN